MMRRGKSSYIYHTPVNLSCQGAKATTAKNAIYRFGLVKQQLCTCITRLPFLTVKSRNDRVENDWGLGWNGAYFLRKGRSKQISQKNKQTKNEVRILAYAYSRKQISCFQLKLQNRLKNSPKRGICEKCGFSATRWRSPKGQRKQISCCRLFYLCW